jgi:hypothetical protein
MRMKRPQIWTAEHPFPLDNRWARLLVLLWGMGLLGLLVATRWLTPDERGLGTHEQLGLPPCGFYLWWGLPCPSCGMTTSWAWFVRGNFLEAARNHFGGALLGVFSLGLGCWMIVSAGLGRWLGGWPTAQVWSLLLGVLTLAIMISWIGKLWA